MSDLGNEMSLPNPARVFEVLEKVPHTEGLSDRSGESGRLARDMFVLLGIFFVATALRLVAIDSQALWSDEGQTLSLSLFPVAEMFWQPTDPTPFLYYALHHVLLSPLSSVTAIRMISVVFGVASVGLMYGLGRLTAGPRAGLFCAALLAVWTAHVDYSMEARAYSLLGFTTLMSFLGVVVYGHAVTGRLASRHAWMGLALLVAGNVLSFYTHVIAAFPIIATSGIVFMSTLVWDRRRLPAVLLVYTVMALLAVPGAIRLFLQAKTGDDFNWLVQPGPVVFVSTVADFFFPIGLWDNPLTNGLNIRLTAKFVCIPVFAIALVATLVLSRRRILNFAMVQPYTALLVLSCLLLPLEIWLAGYVWRPLFLGRVILFCVPGFILLIALMAPVSNPGRARLYGGAMLALMLSSTLLFGMMREKEDWRSASAYLARHAGPNDIVAVCADFNFPAARHSVDTPIGRAAIVPNERGEAILLERGFGSDPGWARTYFDAIQRDRPLNTVELALRPGDSVWRIDASCSPGGAHAVTLDRMLEPLGKDPAVEWKQNAKYYDRVEIRRYHVDRPLDLSLLSGQSPRT